MAGTLSAVDLAARAGITPAELESQISAADRRPPTGPNRAARRAAAKVARKAYR